MLPQTGCSSPAPCPAYGGQGAGQGAGQGRVYISSSPSHQAGGGAGAGRGRAGESRGRARHCSSSGPCGHHGNLATVAAEWNPAQHRCHQHRVSGGAVCSVRCIQGVVLCNLCRSRVPGRRQRRGAAERRLQPEPERGGAGRPSCPARQTVVSARRAASRTRVREPAAALAAVTAPNMD